MKKILTYIFTLAASLMLVNSCSDDLNQRPIIETDAEGVYSQAANYKNVLAKLYASYVIAGQELGGGNVDLATNFDLFRSYFYLQEAGTDEIAYTWNEGDDLWDISFISWDENDVWVSDSYYRIYYTITICNEFIRNAKDEAISHFTETEQNDIRAMRAEARFLRALAYSYIIDLFGQGPFVDETTPLSNYKPEAYSRTMLFDYVEGELRDIEEEMSETTEYGRATRGAVQALLTRLYLNAEVYTGTQRYTDCITYAKKIINNNRYSLESDWGKLFNAENHLRTNEIIFSFVVDSEHTVTWGATTNIVCGGATGSAEAEVGVTGAWGNFRVRGEYVALFDDASSTDTRRRFYTEGQTQYIDGGLSDASNGYYSMKWSNLTDAGAAASNTQAVGVNTDFPVFRLADIYLMLAESVLRGGQGATPVEALTLVNEINERSCGDQSGNISSTELTLDWILDERGRELLWECTRRTDLVRYGRFTGSGRIWQWKGGVKEGRAVDNKYNIYPIPATELSANPNLQNANY